MKNSKLGILLCFGCTSILAASSLFSLDSNFHLEANDSGDYTILIDSKLSYENNKATVYSSLNNPFVLETSGSDGNNVVKLDNGEFLTNVTPISGIKGINISYEGGNLLYALSYEDMANANLEFKTLSNSTFINIDDNVNYFTLKSSNDALEINSIYLTYSCQNTPKKYSVYFDTDGSVEIPSQEVYSLSTVEKPQDPSFAGHSFDGWFIDESFETEYDFNSKVNKNMTLYAKFSELSSYITLTSPKEGAYVDLRNFYLTDFLDNYSKGYSLKYQSYEERYKNNEILFTWDSAVDCDYYVIDISKDPYFANYDSYITTEESFSLKNAYTGVTYYWQVRGIKENLTYICKDIGSFEIANYPRTLDIDGVYNSRDIGGYITDDDRVVKQGMVYRSGKLDDVTDEGKKTMLEELGIKSEIDLRRSGEGLAGTVSPLGDSVEYYNISFPYWTSSSGTGVNESTNWPAIKSAIEKFADPSLYPVSIHCSIGQDRTGSLAILLEGILGVSYHDIMVDYELSSFTSVTYDGSTTITDRFTYQVDPLITFFRNYGSSSASLKTCITNFLTDGYGSYEGVGVSSSTITSIRNILLEGI